MLVTLYTNLDLVVVAARHDERLRLVEVHPSHGPVMLIKPVFMLQIIARARKQTNTLPQPSHSAPHVPFVARFHKKTAPPPRDTKRERTEPKGKQGIRRITAAIDLRGM